MQQDRSLSCWWMCVQSFSEVLFLSHTCMYTVSVSLSPRLFDSVSVRPRRRNKLITSGGVKSPLLLLSSLRHLLSTLELTHTSAPSVPTSWPRESKKGLGQGRRATLTTQWRHFTLVSLLRVSLSEFRQRSHLEGEMLSGTVSVRRRKWSAVDRWAEEWGQVKRERMKEVESGKAAERSERWKNKQMAR